MNCYTMQIQPGREGNDEQCKIREFITKSKIVGVGHDNPVSFNNAQIGDIVLVRAQGSLLVLVEITGDSSPYENSDKFPDFNWISYCRNVEILGWWNIDQSRFKLGATDFRGFLSTFCDAGKNSSVMIDWLNKIKGTNMRNNVKQLLEANKQVILTGAPGTGKTYLAKEIAAEMIGCDKEMLSDNEKRFGFVQFHPSFDYSDFVEGLKPSKGAGNEIGFELTDGIFRNFCNVARGYPEDKPCVFVIDEINRADLSRVFGELFFAVEVGYRGKKGEVETQYSYLREENDKKFSIPGNVYIVGTMNDIDRSVESMDFALRRRFAWQEIEADEACFDRVMADIAGDFKEEAEKRYSALNKVIAETEGLSLAYQIGPAYYRKLEKYSAEPGTMWAKLWDCHLKQLLKEYLRGMSEAKTILDKMEKAYNLNP